MGMVMAGCLAALVLIPACEDADGTTALTVTPSRAELRAGTNSVVFTVESNNLRELSLPLEWSVDNPGRGEIFGSGGYSAVYRVRSGNGVNIVRVRDQYGAEGIATVEQ